MSLINDALKKAQRQRGDDSAGDPAVPGPSRVARRDKPAGHQALLLRAGIGVIAVCAIIVTTVLLVRQPDGPVPVGPAGGTTASTNPGTTPPTSTTEPVIASPVGPKTDPAPAVTVATQPSSNPPAANPVVTPSPSSGTTGPTSPPAGPIQVPNLTLPTASASPAIPAPTQTGEQDKRILAYLSTLRITGIRPAGADSKVLMNDRVYKLNDVVDYSLGLKLTGVAVQRLDFVDERGVSYVKTF